MKFEECEDCISFKKEKRCNEIIFQNWCQRMKRPIGLISICYVNNLKKPAMHVNPIFSMNFQK